VNNFTPHRTARSWHNACAASSRCDVSRFRSDSATEHTRGKPDGVLYVRMELSWKSGPPAGAVGSNPLGELPRITRALAPYRSDILMLSG